MTRVLLSGVSRRSRHEIMEAVSHYATLRFVEADASQVDYRWADVVVLGKFGGHRRGNQAKCQGKIVVFAPNGAGSVVDALNRGIDLLSRSRLSKVSP